MPTLVGIDEAGYGPLLGPLTVGASVWQIDARHVERALAGVPDADADVWSILSKAVCRKRGRDDFRLVIDDSKRVFDQKHGVGPLERTILALAETLDVPRGSVGSLVDALRGESAGESGLSRPATGGERSNGDHPWYERLDRALPVDGSGAAYGSMGLRIAQVMQDARCRCSGLLLQLVPEREFNRRAAQTRNKAAIIVEHVLRLMARVIESGADPPIFFFVDRLGGRTDYRGLLQTAFSERELRIEQLDEKHSRYRLSQPGRDDPSGAADWIFDFSVEADGRHLPVALAGMLCKYVRELLMLEFNQFWRRFEPSLRPTAGYYTDAQRFLADIAPHLAAARLRREDFVRAR